MSKTYNRVHEQILKEKRRVDQLLKQNEAVRQKCIESLRLCSDEIKAKLK